jgi:uncharacterized membrane protein (UPF0127 family)
MRTGIITTLAALLLLSLTSASGARPENLLAGFAKAQLLVDIRDRGCVLFDVYVAQSPQQRSQGLMYVETMDLHEGMLFLYAEEARISMWMKNTLIPLDMFFVRKDRGIATIHENAVPMSEKIIESGADVVAVLELNGGAAKYFGINVADKIIFPAG